MQALDPEPLMDEAIRAAGGRCIRELVGANPPFDNADYLLESDNVIAELKSLEKDFLSDPTVSEKMHGLYNQWVDDGKDVSIMYGEGILQTDQLPIECARELIAIFKDRLEGTVLRKANRQIRETKQHLNHKNALGLLLLSNEGNFAFDPEMVAHVLLHSLGAKYSSLEHVILFSANLVVAGSSTIPSGPLFASIRFPGRRQPSDQFLRRLGSHWSNVIGSATGQIFPPFHFVEPSPADVGQLRFRSR